MFAPGEGESPYVAIYERTQTEAPRNAPAGETPVRRAPPITDKPLKQGRRGIVHHLLETLGPDLAGYLQNLDPEVCQLTAHGRQWLTGESAEVLMEMLAVPENQANRIKYQLSRVRTALANDVALPPKTPSRALPVNARTTQGGEGTPRDTEFQTPADTSPATAAQPAKRQTPPPMTQSGPELFSVRMARDGSLQGPPDDRAAFRATVDMCRGTAPYTISQIVAERLIMPRMLQTGQCANRGTLLSEETRSDPNLFHWLTVLRGRLDPIPGAPAYVLAGMNLLGTSVNNRMIRILAQGELDACRARRGVPEYVSHGEMQVIIQETGYSELLSISERANLVGKPKKK